MAVDPDRGTVMRDGEGEDLPEFSVLQVHQNGFYKLCGSAVLGVHPRLVIVLVSKGNKPGDGVFRSV